MKALRAFLIAAVALASVVAFAPAASASTYSSYSYSSPYHYSSPYRYTPSYRSYTPSYSYGYRRPGRYIVRGYIRRNGTYVSPYLRRYPSRSSYRGW